MRIVVNISPNIQPVLEIFNTFPHLLIVHYFSVIMNIFRPNPKVTKVPINEMMAKRVPKVNIPRVYHIVYTRSCTSCLVCCFINNESLHFNCIFVWLKTYGEFPSNVLKMAEEFVFGCASIS